MSLAPSERQALATIENSLRRTDPRLAAVMTVFTILATRRKIPRWKCLSPWRLRIRRLIPVAIAMAVGGLVVLGGVFLSHTSQMPGPPRSVCGIAIEQTNKCPSTGRAPGHQDRLASQGATAKQSAASNTSRR